MFSAVSYPIVADRFTPHNDYIVVKGFDFAGATVHMQVCDAWNTGIARANIVPVVTLATVGGVPYSTVTWSISEAVMEAIPLNQADPSADVVLFYDTHITPVGGTKFVAWRGTFTIRSGAPQ